MKWEKTPEKGRMPSKVTLLGIYYEKVLLISTPAVGLALLYLMVLVYGAEMSKS